MKSKDLFVATMLLGGAMFVNAQVSNTYTGLGNENGAATATSSAFVGYQAGKNMTGTENTVIGHQAGGIGTGTGSYNCFLGSKAGNNNTQGQANVFVGREAGAKNTTGSYNIFMGFQAGANTTTASANIFLGHGTGMGNTTGFSNVYIGHSAGISSTTGYSNIFIGAGAGSQCTGYRNIFIGENAGGTQTGVNNKLYIANTATTSPAIYGDFGTNKIAIGGFTPYSTSDGFPTTAGSVNVSGYKLFVKGGILTEEVRVALSTGTGWADYVFAEDYKLLTLAEVENYIAKNGHLPNVPSAETVKNDGIGLGEMSKIQQEKIEELTLYAIAQDKKVEAQQKQLDQQQKEIDALKAAVKVLTEKK